MSDYDNARSASWFAREWDSGNPMRVARAATSTVQCPQENCRQLFKPLHSIYQEAFFRCPGCQKNLQLQSEVQPSCLSSSHRRRSCCDRCRHEAKVASATFRQNIGLLLLAIRSDHEGKYCSICIHKQFWKHTLITASVGWIGIKSLFIAPVVIIQNLCNYFAALPGSGSRMSSRIPSKTVEMFQFVDVHRDKLLVELNNDLFEKEDVLQGIAHSLGLLTEEFTMYLDWLAWEQAMRLVTDAGETLPQFIQDHLQETEYRLGGGVYPNTIPMFNKSRDRKYLLAAKHRFDFKPDQKLIRKAA